MFSRSISIPHHQQEAVSVYFSKVYLWMSGALGLSALVAWKTASNAVFMNYLLEHRGLFYFLMFAELGLVIWLSWGIRKMSFLTAMSAFIVYSALTGLTLSAVLLVYTAASVSKVFVLSAGLFGIMALYGYTTKKDLTSWGSFLIMSLIGIILASIVNFFLHSPMIEWVVTYAGIVIFMGLTAYDNQKLKAFALMADSNETFGKLVILGALTLYLDFINLFLHLLRAFGDRR
ncbi:Bax inhibitor-1/YccA family protein [Candidatus Pacearchaeota archaeon]|nr:Bax inhibitor-1/YccA family protein [Candidatus Pacearchaeota archaeon]